MIHGRRLYGLLTAALIGGTGLAFSAYADVLVGTNGERFVGTIIQETTNDVVFASELAGRLTFPRSKISELQRVVSPPGTTIFLGAFAMPAHHFRAAVIFGSPPGYRGAARPPTSRSRKWVASIAATAPIPAEVITWRKCESAASPAAYTPGTLVFI